MRTRTFRCSASSISWKAIRFGRGGTTKNPVASYAVRITSTASPAVLRPDLPEITATHSFWYPMLKVTRREFGVHPLSTQ
jgi:hypothetical protein